MFQEALNGTNLFRFFKMRWQRKIPTSISKHVHYQKRHVAYYYWEHRQLLLTKLVNIISDFIFWGTYCVDSSCMNLYIYKL